MPATASPLCVSPTSVPQSGMPEMKERVPSIGSMTQTWSLDAFSEPNSSPSMPWSGMRGPDQGADRLLGLAISLGHRVEPAFELVGDVRRTAETGAESRRRRRRDLPEELS